MCCIFYFKNTETETDIISFEYRGIYLKLLTFFIKNVIDEITISKA